MKRRRSADPHRTYEVRCPVHGFVELNDWEREILAQPAFQRLRRIRQLAWTDQVYPGAMHTRFEHSLGVMHTATLLYDSVTKRSRPILETELAYNDDGLKRHRALVRLAALLHDVGHGPFSHAAEDLLPARAEGGDAYKHEDYSAAIIRRYFREAIENHPLNGNYDLRAEDVAALIEGSTGAGRTAFWRELISGQMDADRMDYLLRDSLHAGVQYGRFDLGRLVRTVQVVPGVEGEGPRLGISEGGWHAAEGLILARYFMFTQVYFHKTRIAFDHHLHQALKELLPDGCFPPPEGDALDAYLQWDDWRVLGLLANGQGGEHGRRLAARDHYREVFHTGEVPTTADLERLDQVRTALGPLLAAEQSAEKSWYATGVEILGSGCQSKKEPAGPALRSARRARSGATEDPGNRRRDPMSDTSPPWERLATIVELTEKAPGELGRTALVKLCYFLQTLRGVPLGYHFTLYAYGPFDAGVLDDLDYAQALDAVKSRLVNYATGYGYNISPGSAAAEIKTKARDFLADHQAAIHWVVQEFGGMSAAHLELASTAIFVAREAQRTREPLTLEELVRRVREVKPRFSESQVRAIAELLREKSLLSSIQS